MNKHLSTLWLIVFLLICPAVVNAELVLGGAPQLSVTAMAKIWTPYVEYLTKETGEKIRLKLYSDRMEFENDLQLGVLDLYYGNPAYAVIGKIQHGYKPIIRSDKTRLTGIIVVRNDSPFQAIEDLKNKMIVFPDKTAFAASLLIRDHLTNVLNLPYEAAYVSAHDNVYRGVLIGKYPAGGGVKRTLEREPEALRNQLRIIYETPGIKSHPLVIHPRVSEKIKQAVIQATLKLNDFKEGQNLLNEIKMQSPVTVDYDKDYKEIEAFSTKVYDYLL